jgi:hypothetical protein
LNYQEIEKMQLPFVLLLVFYACYWEALAELSPERGDTTSTSTSGFSGSKNDKSAFNANHRIFSPDQLSADEYSEAFIEWSRSSLQTSTWPVDHGDTARSKYTFDAGLPAGVKEQDVKIMSNLNLKGVQWLYTGGKNSEWIYAMSGDSIQGFKVSKINGTTLEIVQQYDLQRSMYTGGMLIHRNGHVYAIHSNNLYVFWNGDIDNNTMVRLPTDLNGKFTLTNGMLVTHDGYLLVKQWSFHVGDLPLILASKKILKKVHTSLVGIFVILFFAILYRKTSVTERSTTKMVAYAFIATFFGYLFASFLGIAGLIAAFRTAQGEFNMLRFVTDGWLSSNGGGGELRLIDPISLQVKASMQLPERCSFARMALQAIRNPQGDIEDAIVLLGDENVHQVRWRPSTSELFWVSSCQLIFL